MNILLTCFNWQRPLLLHAAIAAGLSTGVLRPVVGTELPLREAAKAHVQILAPGAYGKIVLIP